MSEYTVKQTASESQSGFASIELGESETPNFVIPNPVDTVLDLKDLIGACAYRIHVLNADIHNYGLQRITLNRMDEARAERLHLQRAMDNAKIELAKWQELGY